ncbi:hypothetical protein B0T16DRAFT_409816 [Cercophora newfieldiana]|uniref:Uncharacterized protein n=1 Tax=Cercophora newfieldiana TaxID=92897 RepID=A0AA39YB67_9PEZI|nr:hypothetical protein B0T16DRAFT_409816 [Cercophora newfieldiana]
MKVRRMRMDVMRGVIVAVVAAVMVMRWGVDASLSTLWSLRGRSFISQAFFFVRSAGWKVRCTAMSFLTPLVGLG